MSHASPIDPAALRPEYSEFLRSDRVLLTGHSHQAWPDAARVGLLRAWEDAACHVDDKWAHASVQADRVRAAVADRIGTGADQIALGVNTHEMVARFLSSLDLQRRPHLVTTAGEFHSLDRQLRRLIEAGIEVTFVPADPPGAISERLAAAIRPNTAAVLASTVLFETSAIVHGLDTVTRAAHAAGAAVLYDAYHAFNVLPFAVAELGPDPVYVTAGGYKYAQWGEGCCWLRVPPDDLRRPVITGWFSDFEGLDAGRQGGFVGYGPTPALRFAGSTYDPVSHYRAAAVAAFFDQRELTVTRLRALSLRQTSRLIGWLCDDAGLNLATPVADSDRVGFVALAVSGAAEVVRRLRHRGVYADARGSFLRFGPAPYVTDDELDRACAHILAACREVAA